MVGREIQRSSSEEIARVDEPKTSPLQPRAGNKRHGHLRG